ncbi:hypothetical protein OPQ81_000355 [Rhizoctonia solani]|nr:hypothetical protein OPQ81_000355 [Rhizoctonia solani]
MPHRIPPGPAGTSCLNCKLRHKRCDKRQPECERCIKGGYECLGYGHIRGTTAKSRGIRARQSSLPTEEGNLNAARIIESNSTGNSISGNSRGVSSEEGHCGILETMVSLSSSANNSPSMGNNDQLAQTLNKNSLTSTIARNSNTHQPSALNHISFGDSRAGPSPHQLFALSTRMPRTSFGEAKVFFHSITFEDYVIAHGEMMMERSYFKPLKNQTELVKRATLARLQKSSFTRWIMFLCARICESFLKGDASQNQIYDRWIGDVERALKSVLNQDLASHEAEDRLEDRLEVQLLKTMMGNCGGTYQVLRTVTPTFLQMVFSDPGLWSTSGDPTSVPLGSIIASTRHTVAYFALTDSLSAMAFGLPQQVEYDTFGYTPTSVPVPFEWIHSSPAEFQIMLAGINACRDKRPGARTREELERQLFGLASTTELL